MLKTEKFIYGIVKECVTEIVNRIDWIKMEFPDFYFCDNPHEGITLNDLKNDTDGISFGDGWFGCKDVSYVFNGDRYNIALLFGYCGGGYNELVTIDEEEKSETEAIIKWICDAIYNSAYLDEDDLTLFELMEG